MIKFYFNDSVDSDLKIIDQAKPGTLVYIENPNEKELETLEKDHGLDLDLLLDGLDPNESPRIETWDSRVYIYTRIVLPESEKQTTMPVLIIFGVNMVYVISRTSFTAFNKLINNTPINTSKRAKMLMQVLSVINAGYKQRINNIARRIYGMRSQLDKAHIANKDFVTLIDIEEDLNDILLALEPMNALLNTLLKGKPIKLYDDDRDLMEDLELSSDELIRLSASQLKTIKNIREAYSTITANSLNKVFKLMTSITILMGIFTLITGIYSMNIALPAAHNPQAFWIIIGITGGLIGIVAYFFRKNKWF